MVSILVLPFSGLDGIELGFLGQQSSNHGKTICEDASCYEGNYWHMRYPSNHRKCGGKV